MNRLCRAVLYSTVFVPLVVVPGVLQPFIVPKVTAFRLAVVLVTVLSILWCRRPFPAARGATRTAIVALGGLLGWLLLCTVIAGNVWSALWSTPSRMDGPLRWLVCATFAVLLVQHLRADRAAWRRLASLSLATSAVVASVAWAFGGPRLWAPLGSASILGTYATLHAIGAAARAIGASSTIHRAGYGLLSLLLTAVVLGSASRAALLALLVGTVLAFVITDSAQHSLRRLAAVGAAALLAPVLATAAQSFGLHNHSLILRRSVQGRVLGDRPAIYEAALRGVLDRPLTGWGADGIEPGLTAYFDGVTWVDRCHSVWLDVALMGGMPAVVGAMATVGLAVMAVLTPARPLAERRLALGLGGAWLTSHTFGIIDPTSAAALAAGTAWWWAMSPSDVTWSWPRSLHHPARAVVLAAGILFAWRQAFLFAGCRTADRIHYEPDDQNVLQLARSARQWHPALRSTVAQIACNRMSPASSRSVLDQAWRETRAAAMVEPKNATLRIHLVDLAIARGRIQTGLNATANARTIAPRNIPLLLRGAALLIQAGEYGNAHQWATHAYGIRDDDATAVVFVYTALVNHDRPSAERAVIRLRTQRPARLLDPSLVHAAKVSGSMQWLEDQWARADAAGTHPAFTEALQAYRLEQRRHR